jgi:tight adherence protein B
VTYAVSSSSALAAATAAGFSAWLMTTPGPRAGSGAGGTTRVMMVGLGVVALVLVVPRGWVGPVVVLVPALGGARVLWRRRTTARLASENAARMAEVCDLLAAELSAGRPPDVALREGAVAWAALAPVAEVARLGGDVPTALRETATLPGASGLGLLAAAWTVSQRTGGSLGAATRRVADTVRRQQATRSVVAGELASARATARLMAGLPLVALLMGSGAGADPWSFLLGTPAGLACLAAGLAAGMAGLWWIEQIARAVEG